MPDVIYDDEGFMSKRCGKCGEYIWGGHPKGNVKNEWICYDCLYEMFEEMVKLNMGGVMPFFFAEMSEKYFSTRKRKQPSRKLKEKVLMKYHHICVSCGSTEKLEIDHIKPVSKGGKNIFTNLQVLCKTCNLKKGVKYGKTKKTDC